jgi:hypothetical protein
MVVVMVACQPQMQQEGSAGVPGVAPIEVHKIDGSFSLDIAVYGMPVKVSSRLERVGDVACPFISVGAGLFVWEGVAPDSAPECLQQFPVLKVPGLGAESPAPPVGDTDPSSP